MKKWSVPKKIAAAVLTAVVAFSAAPSPAVGQLAATYTVEAKTVSEEITTNVGETVTLTEGLKKYKSSDENVLTVSSAGVVLPIASGTAEVTAKKGKNAYSWKITVVNPKLENGYKDAGTPAGNFIYPKSYTGYAIPTTGTPEGASVFVATKVKRMTSNSISAVVADTEKQTNSLDKIEKRMTKKYMNKNLSQVTSQLGVVAGEEVSIEVKSVSTQRLKSEVYGEILQSDIVLSMEANGTDMQMRTTTLVAISGKKLLTSATSSARVSLKGNITYLSPSEELLSDAKYVLEHITIF